MTTGALGVARYRLRTTFRHRWGGYLSLIILVGLIGGLGLGSLAAARRTQSSFSTFLASTNPRTSTVSVYSGGVSTTNPNYDPALTAAIARLPHVRHVAAAHRRDGRSPDGRRVAEVRGHRRGLSRGQRQRAALHPGPRRRAPRVACRRRTDPTRS